MNFDIQCKDCLAYIKEISDNTVDLIITSPPYNVDLGANKYNKNAYSLYKDNKEHSEYIQWLKEIFSQVYSKMKSGGRICINVGDGKNGAVPTTSDIIHFMSRELNYIPVTHIIWNKNTTSARTAWGSWMSPSCPSYPTPFEHILIFAKDSMKLQHTGETDLTKEEFTQNAFAMWNFSPDRDAHKLGHPAPFPLELPLRCIKMNSYIGDTVFDPFVGSGTTAVACKMTGRNFIGCDIDPKYVGLAKQRLNETDYTTPLW